MVHQLFETGSSLGHPDATAASRRQPLQQHYGTHNRMATIVHDDDVIEIMDSDDEHINPYTEASTSKPLIPSSTTHIADLATAAQPLGQTLTEVIEIDDDQVILNPFFALPDQEKAATSPSSTDPILNPIATLPASLPPPTTLREGTTLLEYYSLLVAQVIEIVPDADPGHILALVTDGHKQFGDEIVGHILQDLFENTTYPRVDIKGKRKAIEQSRGNDYQGFAESYIDYTNTDRPPPQSDDYFQLALQQLLSDFSYVPSAYIHKSFIDNHEFYAPTHILLRNQESAESQPYVRSSKPNRVTGKGKTLTSPEFEAERAWIVQWELSRQLQGDAAIAASLDAQQYEETGAGIECACCFTDYPFDQLVQCPDAHLFCKDCIVKYASAQLGSQDANLLCMDQSGCKLPFAPSQLRRFLPEKLMKLYDRILAEQSVSAAAIEGLEECPHCDFKYVIENPDEKLFVCRNEECLQVTCRMCKKPDHLPKNCEEVVDDRQRNAQHAVDEAMTQALMRNCPKCHTAFIKENGCNKMTCPKCKAISCYTCRKLIKGYDHFSQGQRSSKCSLHDNNVETRHAQEVRQAAEAKINELRRENPEVDIDKVKVDVAQAGPANAVVPVVGGMWGVPPPALQVIPQLDYAYMPPALPVLPLAAWDGGANGGDRPRDYYQYPPGQNPRIAQQIAVAAAVENQGAHYWLRRRDEMMMQRAREQEARLQLLRERRAQEARAREQRLREQREQREDLLRRLQEQHTGLEDRLGVQAAGWHRAVPIERPEHQANRRRAPAERPRRHQNNQPQLLDEDPLAAPVVPPIEDHLGLLGHYPPPRAPHVGRRPHGIVHAVPYPVPGSRSLTGRR